MASDSRRPTCGFTLIELIAVVVLIGLVAVIGLVSVSGPLDQVALSRAIEQIELADRRERQAAARSPVPGRLSVDRKGNQLFFERSAKTIKLGGGVRIARIVVQSPRGQGDAVWFAQSGQSYTYALELRSPRGARRWLVVIGISGQTIRLTDAGEAQSLLAACE